MENELSIDSNVEMDALCNTAVILEEFIALAALDLALWSKVLNFHS